MRPICYKNYRGQIIPWDDREDCDKCDYWISCQNETLKLYNELEEEDEKR